MRKILLLLFIGLCSCSQNQNMNEVSNNDVRSVNVSIDPLKIDGYSRANLNLDVRKIYWQMNDTIGIFPNKGGQVEFPIEENSVGSTKAEFNGGGWALKGNYAYSGYYPFNFYNRNPKKIPYSFKGQTQNGNNSVEHLRNYLFMVSDPTYVNNGMLNFSMGYVGLFFRIEVTLPEVKTYTSLELRADSDILPLEKTIDITQQRYAEQDFKSYSYLHMDLEGITTTVENEKVILWVAFPYMDKPGETLQLVLSDSEGKSYSGNIIRNNATFELTNMVRGGFVVMQSSPVLESTNHVTGSIENWEIGEVIMGSANQS